MVYPKSYGTAVWGRCSFPAVSKHLKNIFEEGELLQEMTISKMETVINRSKRGKVNE